MVRATLGLSFESEADVISKNIGVKDTKGMASDISEDCKARMN
jgi:hypothetical protein